MEAYIVGGLRSYVGLAGGIYKNVPAELLGAAVLKQVIEKYNINAIDCIIGGNGVGAGGNITRLMALEAGVAQEVPAFSVDVQCGSGLESIAIAAAKINSGEADCIIAGGFESSSTQPKRAYNPEHPGYAEYGPDWYKVAKFIPDIHRETVMLEGAELAAVQENISKEELDAWALKSHQLATKAREQGLLKNIIAPVWGAIQDEGIRTRMSEKLLRRMPKLLPGGQNLTAGNACMINDGAAWLVICSKEYLEKYGLKAQAKVISSTACGGDPLVSPKTAITALEKLLQKQGLTEADIDDFELNEAFAVIDVLFARSFSKSLDKYNVFGGALAYGHPYGASGGIITLHLLEALRQRGGRLGCVSVAAAGGVGTAMLIESIH